MGVIRNQHRRNSTSNESNDQMSINDLLDEVANQLEDQTLDESDNQDGQLNDMVIIVPNTGHRVTNLNTTNRMRSDGRMANLIAEVEQKRAEKRFKKSNSCKYNPPRPEPTFRGLGCRGRSNRKHRRFENGNMVAQSLAIVGLEMDLSSSLDVISIDDFIPTSVSAFARLLMEKEHMKAWNDFIQCSEEEQEDFLRIIDSRRENEWVTGGSNINGNKSQNVHNKMASKKVNDNRSDAKSTTNTSSTKAIVTTTGSIGQKDQNRTKHPAFSPEISFARIDGNLKKFLKQKRIPMNLLETIEEEVSVFFETQPIDSIYRSCLPTGFQRLLLHATAQYLNLVCKSFDHDGNRLSHVSNKNGTFIRPTVKLSEYLESPRPNKFHRPRFGRRIRGMPNNISVDPYLG